jgi:hypothetical protein
MCQFPENELEIPYNTVQSIEMIFVPCFILINTFVCTELLRGSPFVTFENIYDWA